MTPSKAVKLAVANMIFDGLDDVLPTPIEIDLLRKNLKLKETIRNGYFRENQFLFKPQPIAKF